MALAPICPNCKGGLFTTTDYPVVAVRTLKLVHCVSCGTVVGGLDSRVQELENNVALLISLVRDLTEQLNLKVRY